MRTPKNDAEGYGFIVAYFTKHNTMPSFQQIADHMKYISKRSVSMMIARLSRAGFVKMQTRSLVLMDNSLHQTIENTQSLIHNLSAHVGRMAADEFRVRSEMTNEIS